MRHAQEARPDHVAVEPVLADQRSPARRRRAPCSGARPCTNCAPLESRHRPEPESDHRHREGAVASTRAVADDLVLQHGHAQAGAALRSAIAVASPWKPPPTMATSTTRSPASAGLGVYGTVLGQPQRRWRVRQCGHRTVTREAARRRRHCGVTRGPVSCAVRAAGSVRTSGRPRAASARRPRLPRR